MCFSTFLSEPKETPEEGSDKEREKSAPENESAVKEDPLGPKCFYNKAKCFFDNISSELKSRYNPNVRSFYQISN